MLRRRTGPPRKAQSATCGERHSQLKPAPCQQPSRSQHELGFISGLIGLMTVQPDRGPARKRHFTRQNHEITMPKFSLRPNSICCCFRPADANTVAAYFPRRAAGGAQIRVRSERASARLPASSGSVCLSSALFPGSNSPGC